MIVYLDSSVVLRKILGEPRAIPDWGRWQGAMTSALTRVEGSRALDRLRLGGGMNDQEAADKFRIFGAVLDEIETIALDPAILRQASQAYPTVLGTLDAIHLSSALLYEREANAKLVFLTHDVRLGIAAQAAGFEVRGLEPGA